MVTETSWYLWGIKRDIVKTTAICGISGAMTKGCGLDCHQCYIVTLDCHQRYIVTLNLPSWLPSSRACDISIYSRELLWRSELGGCLKKKSMEKNHNHWSLLELTAFQRVCYECLCWALWEPKPVSSGPKCSLSEFLLLVSEDGSRIGQPRLDSFIFSFFISRFILYYLSLVLFWDT